MFSRSVSSRDITPLPAAPPNRDRPLELIVPYFDSALAAFALSSALRMAEGVQAAVTLMAVHVLPYPSPLEEREGIRQRLESQLAAVARTSPVSMRIKLVFARSSDEAYLGLLPRDSLVVVAARNRWWKTREERFAGKLAACGYRVSLIKVK